MAETVYNNKASDPQSVLVILPTWLGDFVMATPALRSIRNRFRDAEITFLMEPNLRELVRGGDWMDECIELPPKGKRSVFHTPYRAMLKQLRTGGAGGGRFDLAILFPNSLRSAIIAYLAGAKRRVGYNRDGRGLFLTDAVKVRNRRNKPVPNYASTGGRDTASELGATGGLPASAGPSINTGRQAARGTRKVSHAATLATAKDVLRPDCPIPVGEIPEPTRLPVKPEKYIPIPIVEYYADLVEAVGCERPGDTLELFTTPDCDASLEKRLHEIGIADKRPLVVISPGAKFGASKCWPPERFAALLDQLIESQGATVIVTCGPGEQGIVAAIGLAMKRGGHIFDAPLLPLGELKSLINRCDLLVCNDAGPRHFAKAFGVPVVTVFGPTHPDWTATTHARERIVRVNVDCGPCQQKTCPLGHLECMTGVSVDAVEAAAREMLNQTASAPARFPTRYSNSEC